MTTKDDLIKASSEDFKRLNGDALGLATGGIKALTSTSVRSGKYNNKKTQYNGYEYDSKKEAVRAQELDLAKAAGSVIAWFPQVRFNLSNGIDYIADFVVIKSDWSVTVEDVKSSHTKKLPVYRMKRKLFLTKFGREIEEI